MTGSIRIDLEEAEQRKAAKMIEFLFAFCLSKDDAEVLVCDEESLGRAFEKVKEIAERSESGLVTRLSEL
jgi:hypothetical protein